MPCQSDLGAQEPSCGPGCRNDNSLLAKLQYTRLTHAAPHHPSTSTWTRSTRPSRCGDQPELPGLPGDRRRTSDARGRCLCMYGKTRRFRVHSAMSMVEATTRPQVFVVSSSWCGIRRRVQSDPSVMRSFTFHSSKGLSLGEAFLDVLPPSACLGPSARRRRHPAGRPRSRRSARTENSKTIFA